MHRTGFGIVAALGKNGANHQKWTITSAANNPVSRLLATMPLMEFAIERGSANRPPIRDLGPEFDLRRQPVLPTDRELGIFRAAAGVREPASRLGIANRQGDDRKPAAI